MGPHHPVGLALHDVLHHVGILDSNILEGGEDEKEKKEVELVMVEKYMMVQFEDKNVVQKKDKYYEKD